MESKRAQLVHIPTMVMDQRTSAMFRFPRDDRLFGKAASGLTLQKFPDIRYALANWSILFDAQYLAHHDIRFDPSQRMFEDHLFILNLILFLIALFSILDWRLSFWMLVSDRGFLLNFLPFHPFVFSI